MKMAPKCNDILNSDSYVLWNSGTAYSEKNKQIGNIMSELDDINYRSGKM